MKQRAAVLFVAVFAVALAMSLAQEGPSQQTPAPQQPAPQQPAPQQSSPSPAPSPGQQQPTQVPGTRQQQQPAWGEQQDRSQFPEMRRPIFLSGKVVLDDGTPPPDTVTIERVCNGVVRPEAYTDSKGRFSFQLGQSMNVMPDASTSGAADAGIFGSNPQTRGGMSGGLSERDLMGCELRASLPGFRSEMVNLAGRRVMDNPDVGTIILKRLGNVEGRTISATTALAPKDARKAYDKARDNIKKQKWADAQKELEKAVAAYPKYAAAWHQLGLLHEQQKNTGAARKAYAESLSADAKFLGPYLQLAMLAVRDTNWQDVADITSRLVRLDPFDYPQAFFYNAVANFNLRKLDDAEKSAREALKIDTDHRIAKTSHLLGVILAQKNDYTGAVEHIENYLKFAPEAKDAEQVRKQLDEIRKFAAGAPQQP
ncbi:MAG: tetratricopeptide repeat protein [Acidobacteria bacterium]|nr:tetratricopeptide repeat protein [Acidobacteriota bacterium]